MGRTLFITGSSGFIASRLLRKINRNNFKNIYCLSRNESEVIREFSRYENFKFIRGDIFDATLYAPYLTSADIVVHLAAATGKAGPEEYFKVNAEGTRFLVKQCEQSGVKNFLFISSIAVKFKEISRYYYAQAKLQGELAVKESRLNYSIVRPAIVIGKGSPILKSLLKLAGAPVVPVFGDGKVKVQPVYVDDLADCLVSIIDEEIFLNETFDIGGPEVISIEDFIKKISRAYFKKEPGVIHIPMTLLLPVLTFFEKFFYSLLPFNVGQVSSFRFDGTIEENRLFQKHSPHMKNIDEMLRAVIDNG